EAQLKGYRKTATIRLGDKSRKYQKGMIVAVLAGARFSARQHIFDAVIDKVEVKTISELSPNEIEHDNPEIRHTEELCRFLGQLYNRDGTEDDTITLIRFSAIKPSYGFWRFCPRLIRMRSSSGARSCAPHSSQSIAKVEEKGA